MTELPRRKRFQIHLSTAIALMFVAGVLTWANVRERRVDPQSSFSDFGWPTDVVARIGDYNRFFYQGVIFNLVTAFNILYVTWRFSEWLIRRRAVRRGASAMTEPPRRKRFQIHLSSAIAMMFVAGALIWANVTQSWYYDYSSPYEIGRRPAFGWPYTYLHPSDFALNNNLAFPYDSENRIVMFKVLALDILIALQILFAVWFLCEWLIRRGRAARKGA